MRSPNRRVGEELYPSEFLSRPWLYGLGLCVGMLGIYLGQHGFDLLGGLLALAVPVVFFVEAALRMPRLRSEAFALLERHAPNMTVREIDREIEFIVRQYAGGGRTTERRAEEIRRLARDAAEPDR